MITTEQIEIQSIAVHNVGNKLNEEGIRFSKTELRTDDSINNLLLILSQRPDATRVAGYRTWQSVGRQVTKGQRIGAQGATGRVTGVHLHFELHKGGPWKAVNPLQLGVFDDGGMLPPGGLAVNLSRRPEPVFSADQWDMISAGGVPGTSNGPTIHAPITALGADPQAVAAEVMWHVRGYGRQHVGSGR